MEVRIGDLCWFWDKKSKYPVLGKLTHKFEDTYSEIKIYDIDYEVITSIYGIDGLEYISKTEFEYCEVYKGFLPVYFIDKL